MTLVEFLTARLNEDEALAQASYDAAVDFQVIGPEVAEYHINNWKPVRVLAEVDAKRRIVELHRLTDRHGSVRIPIYCDFCDAYGMDEGLGEPDYPWPCEHLRLLTLPYAEHPDYDEAWRP